MKPALLLLLLAFTAFQLALCDRNFPSIFTGEMSDFNIETISKANSIRREYAKKNNVANMNKLTMSFHLITIAQRLAPECEKVRPGSIYRYVLLKPDAAAAAHEENLKLYLDYTYARNRPLWNERVRSMEQDTAYHLEFLVAEQRQIGCTFANCTRTVRDEQTLEYTTINYGALCLLGPERLFQGDRPKWYAFDEKKGDPGSACLQGLVNDDGLCVLPPPQRGVTRIPKPTYIPPSTAPPGTAPTKLETDEINDFFLFNELRRNWARNNGVSNMWRVEPDYDLRLKAQKLAAEDCEKVWPTENYRYFMRHTDKTNKEVAAATHEIFKTKIDTILHEWDRKEFENAIFRLEELDRDTASVMEFLIAEQRDFGCASASCARTVLNPKTLEYQTIEYENLCLFGPSGKLMANPPYNYSRTLPPFNQKYGELASDCGPDGIKEPKEDGGVLCVRKIPRISIEPRKPVAQALVMIEPKMEMIQITAVSEHSLNWRLVAILVCLAIMN
ncbi:unnamed protein product [Caenorhabditis sp. 36 PRJEB53466]|nr:unnamed protein product [Caenorhabditis sp. 36 PRJEB53466]